MFEDTRVRLARLIKGKQMLVDFLAGGFAGFCSTMANNPVDVVKTNMQSLNTQTYNSVLGTFRHIYKVDGIYGFYKGVGPRVLQVMIDAALTNSIFQSLKRVISN